MTRRRLAETLVLVVLGALISGTNLTRPADAAGRQCSTAFFLYAEGVTCKTARRLRKHWTEKVMAGGKANRRVLTFRCRAVRDEVEGASVVCRKGRRFATWPRYWYRD